MNAAAFTQFVITRQNIITPNGSELTIPTELNSVSVGVPDLFAACITRLAPKERQSAISTLSVIILMGAWKNNRTPNAPFATSPARISSNRLTWCLLMFREITSYYYAYQFFRRILPAGKNKVGCRTITRQTNG